jgi:Tol biopolymer transport system component
MGAVYLAERADDQYRKEVALKILPPWSGRDQRRHQRFLEERQILAALDHPGIARLLDGGVTPDGLPWFAMEYVDGQPIDRYCDSRRLSIEERLILFCDVCAAVQYAHRNLVVHRDLKPSNILVAADNRVALLDFGIARLLAADPASLAASTATGDRLLTPLFASPEQIRGEPASTAADVYALGVLLHVLLTARSPYRLPNHEGYEVARAVLEQEPERPSVSVLRETGGAMQQHGVASRAIERSIAPAKLSRRLRGDLDAIVLKALEKEPSRRYATTEQLETDVRRHLAGLPVVAQPASRAYIARKFVRRHRVGVGIAAAATVVALVVAAAMTVQGVQIRNQAERIALERDRAEQVSLFFMKVFQRVTPGDSGIAAREILDSAMTSVDQQLVAHPEQHARFMFEIAEAYHRLDLHDMAAGPLEVALAIRRTLRPTPLKDIAQALDLQGSVLLAQASTAPAERAFREAVALRRRELGQDHPDVARSLIGLSSALQAQGRLPEAEQLAREAVGIDRSRRSDGRADLARSTSALAHLVAARGDQRTATGLFRQALALLRATHPEEHPLVAAAIFELASALNNAGERAEADSLIRIGLALQRRLLTVTMLRSETGPSPPSLARTVVVPTIPAPVLGDGTSRIVFTSDRDGPDPKGDQGNQEIYVMNADGTGQRRLTHEQSGDFHPSWSPDGTMIAFASQRGRGFDIFIMNADGSQQERLTRLTDSGFGAVEPAWSPDGKRIAFRSRVGQVDIYVISVDGTGLTRLTTDPGGAFAPAWSPDGRKIAFSSRRHGSYDIFVMDADGGNPVRLTSNVSIDRRPAWSPDGRRIAFHSDRTGDQEIYVMNADGSDQVRLTTNPGEDAHPSWSPDGQRITFHRRVLGHVQVHVMNADGSGVRRLTDLSTVAFSGFPNWGPGSR